MGAFTDAMKSGTHPLVWLDLTDYAGRVLAGGAIPWLDCAAFLAWQRKAQALLKSGVVGLPLATVCEEWAAMHAELVAAMRAKQRILFPLKALLADDALRSHLLEMVRSLRASFSHLPLALVAPYPRTWANRAHAQAHSLQPEAVVNDDDAEVAATYVADFLRTFSDCGVDVLLLEESAVVPASSLESIELQQAVFNLAAHYRWEVGLHLPRGGVCSLRGTAATFVIAPGPCDIPTGLIVPENFWSGEALPALRPGDFLYATIPAQVSPEFVLDGLAVLGGSARGG
jgi:hypothetical protein